MPDKAPKSHPIEQTQLFLRIKHPTLDPKEITAVLGMQPEHSVTAGDNVSSAGVRRLFNETYWLAALPSWSQPPFGKPPERSTGALSEFFPEFSAEDRKLLMRVANPYDFSLIAWLRRLDVHRAFIAHINQTDGSVTLLLTRRNKEAPYTLLPSIAKRLSELGLALEID